MAERYIRSPTKASPYAFWTYHNVWFNRSGQNQAKLPKNSDDLSAKKVPNKNARESDVEHDESSKSETAGDNGVIATTETVEIDKTEDEEIRKNVWSDVDDELYIANVIKSRTSDEVKRDIRDTSIYSDSDISAKVVSSVKLDNSEMWELEPTDLTECDCLGPPPEFLLPPPPRPPFLQADYYCGDDPIPDLETCDTEPVSYSSILTFDRKHFNI